MYKRQQYILTVVYLGRCYNRFLFSTCFLPLANLTGVISPFLLTVRELPTPVRKIPSWCAQVLYLILCLRSCSSTCCASTGTLFRDVCPPALLLFPSLLSWRFKGTTSVVRKHVRNPRKLLSRVPSENVTLRDRAMPLQCGTVRYNSVVTVSYTHLTLPTNYSV